MRIAFFGSSLVSSYWNGAATYYRGMLKEIAALGHSITFYEPDAFDRQANRDIADPDYARVDVYPATEDGWQRALADAVGSADLLIKASGVGVFDAELETAIAQAPGSAMRFYWDVDAPATLDAIEHDADHHLRDAIPHFDLVLTYGGGEPVVSAFRRFGARDCVPLYNALDPATHFPAAPDPRFACDLGLLANRLPDRETRIERFFLDVAERLPDKQFVLGGSGWSSKAMPANVRAVGHVGTGDHNAFFASGRATLNVNRDSMAKYGFSPPTRVFEAIGCGACLITDAWEGVELFLELGREVLVAANADDVVHHLRELTPERAAEIAGRARRHILADHTYARRAQQFNRLFNGETLATTEAAE